MQRGIIDGNVFIGIYRGSHRRDRGGKAWEAEKHHQCDKARGRGDKKSTSDLNEAVKPAKDAAETIVKPAKEMADEITRPGSSSGESEV